MRKSFNKGFTLIEVLAILIVLAIIAVITVPVALNVIEKSNKSAALDSAYGYIDSVRKFYFSSSLEDIDNDIDDGTYTVAQMKSNGVIVTGNEPSEGWVKIGSGNILSYSLKFGNYVVTKNPGSEPIATIGTTVSGNPSVGPVIKNKDYYSNQVAAEVASYISSVTTVANNSSYTEDKLYSVEQVTSELNIKNPGLVGWIYYDLDTASVSDYSLKITRGGYIFVVNSIDGIVSSPVESTTILPSKILETTNISIEVIKEGSTLATGDTVKLKWGSNTEEFIVILNDPKAPTGTTMLLAVNNLNVGPCEDKLSPVGFQGLNGDAYDYSVAFSETKYWEYNPSDNDIYDSSKNKAPGDNDYSVAYYVNMYVTNLKNLGFTGVNSGRILTLSEVKNGGIANSYVTSEEYYWLASSRGNGNEVYDVRLTGSTGYSVYYNGRGVRPVIYISTSDIQ